MTAEQGEPLTEKGARNRPKRISIPAREGHMGGRSDVSVPELEVAGNGLLDRRIFLKQGVALLGAGGLVATASDAVRAAEPPGAPSPAPSPGEGMSDYGHPAKYESKVKRTLIRSQPGTTGSGASRTPLEMLEGTLTPSGLHFERHHSGVPDIDPNTHRVLIHGMVKRPLDLHRRRAARDTRWCRASISWSARATAARCTGRRRRRSRAGRSTVSSPAASGPACRCASCWRRPASIPALHGSSPRARTRRR